MFLSAFEQPFSSQNYYRLLATLVLRVIFYHCAVQGVPIVIDWVEDARRESSSASGNDNIVTLFEPIKKKGSPNALMSILSNVSGKSI